MGIIQEVVDLLDNLRFFGIVHEYEQGLYFSRGVVRPRRIRGKTKQDLEDIVKEEDEVIKKAGGKKKFIMPFKRPKLPKGYRRSFWTGLPLHPKRFDKVLRPGIYLYIPFVDKIVNDYRQERVLNLGYVSAPTTDSNHDSRVMAVSCNIRYELMDLYRAYMSVHDYEASLRDHTLSILARHCRGRSYDDWKRQETVKEVERSVLKELREVVTDRWGLKIHEVYVTDNVACDIKRIVHEGTAVSIKNEIKQEDSSLL